ncbi:hypothetical protein SNEBB_001985 [Seison nebaliae]|nr:hypothetical protein SNEBB_001985 [Seison nebaliae]
MKYNVLVLSISDTRTIDDDKSGTVIFNYLEKHFKNFEVYRKLITDDFIEIKESLIEAVDKEHLNLIITTGGTGYSYRDNTPDATTEVKDKDASSLIDSVRNQLMINSPHCILSRSKAVIRKNCLIINLPGSPKAVIEYMEILGKFFPHILAQLNNEITNLHYQHNICTNSHRMSNKISWFEAVKILNEYCDIRLFNKYYNPKDLMGKELENDYRTKIPIPPFRTSMKDGYAINSNDIDIPYQLLKHESFPEQQCHRSRLEKENDSMYVATGGRVPINTTKVLMVEDVEVKENLLRYVKSPREFESSTNNIREMGCDLMPDEIFFKKNEVVDAFNSLLLISQGFSKIKYKTMKIAYFSTGNEIVPMEQFDFERKESNCVMDYNHEIVKHIISSLSLDNSIIKFQSYGVASDTYENVSEIFGKVLDDGPSLIITSGGISMGKRDFIYEYLTRNCEIKINGVHIKPGKPFTFSMFKNIPIFSLPGNPVSTYVTCRLFVTPFIGGFDKITRKISYNIKPVKFNFLINRSSEYSDNRIEFIPINADNIPAVYQCGTSAAVKLLSNTNSLYVRANNPDDIMKNLTDYKGYLIKFD